MHLLDTNVVSDAMADHPRLRARLAHPPGPVTTSVVVLGEIRSGLERLPAGKRRNQLTTKANLVLATLPAEPVIEAVAATYATLRRAVELQGLSLDDNDLWIAATA